MPTDVVMPQMGESIVEGTLTKWLKKPGDKVQRDEPLFEISTDKVDAEIPSPSAGVLREIRAKEGDTVAVDTVVAAIGQGPNPTLQRSTPQLITRKGKIVIDERGRTSMPMVFAGGDVATGGATVIMAMGAGKKAAKAIDEYLRSGNW